MAKFAKGDERDSDYETWFDAAVREGIAAADRGELVPRDEAMKDIRARIAEVGAGRR